MGNKEQQMMLRAVVQSRLDIAFDRLRGKPDFAKLLRQLDESDKAVGKLLDKLPKDERKAVYSHYEGMAARESEELYEAYMQGMGDLGRLFSLLRVTGPAPMDDIIKWLSEKGVGN
jgi:hypothetical protein